MDTPAQIRRSQRGVARAVWAQTGRPSGVPDDPHALAGGTAISKDCRLHL